MPEKDTKARLQQVLDVQKAITEEIHAARVGQTMLVLVEGHSKRQKMEYPEKIDTPLQWSGRTTCNKIVNFIANGSTKSAPADLSGETVCVTIERALSHSLWGKLQEKASDCSALKGDRSYAA